MEKKRGGARPNSGRKKTTKAMSFYIDLDLCEKLKDFPNRNRFINSAIREKLDRMETFIKEVNDME